MSLFSLSSMDGSITNKDEFRKTFYSLLLAALVPAMLLIMPLNASATVIVLEAHMDGAQANAGAGTGSLGNGSAQITYDDVTGLLSWNITWGGLTGPATVAHFHGPALPDQNAGVQVPINASSPSIGSVVISAPQSADLLAGLWYVNIHTASFPAGEIRGQVSVSPPVAPIPALTQWTLLLLSTLLVLTAFAYRKRLT